MGIPTEFPSPHQPDSYLRHFQRKDLAIPGNLRIFSFQNGTDLEPFRQQLSPGLIRLWASALSRDETDPLVLEDSSKYPYKDDHIILLQDKDTKEFPAIFLYKPLTEHLDAIGVGLYLNICLVHQDYQGQGLVSSLLENRIAEFQARFLVLHTQNEYMVQALRRFCPQGYLFPIDGQISKELLHVARSYVHNHKDFDPKTMVEKGLYCKGNPLYGDRKERHSSHKDIRLFFHRHVNFQKGDSALVLGIIK